MKKAYLIISSLIILFSFGALVLRFAKADTFGYTTKGSAGSSAIGNKINGSTFTGMAGTAQSISFWINGNPIGNPMKGALYDTSGNLIAVTEEDTSNPASDTLITINFVGEPELTNQEYVIVVWSANNITNGSLYYDGGSTNQGHIKSLNYTGTFPETIAFDTNNDNKYSIYVTYSPSAPPAPTVGDNATSTIKSGTLQIKNGTMNIK